LSTFYGRLRNSFEIYSPLKFFTSSAQLQNAKDLLEQYKQTLRNAEETRTSYTLDKAAVDN